MVNYIDLAFSTISQFLCLQEANPKVALLFYWDVFERQVRVEGTVEFMSHEESSRIWYNLSRKTQLGFAVITNGSQIQDRDAMTDQYKESEKHFEGHEVIPKPSSWTGVRVVPRKFEFWQGQEDLLSDRFVFERSTEETSGDPEKEWIAGWLLYRKLP
ncbi:Pyridoxine/pyridoxamine 5'-phosphate oxidase 1, chloroplastic [Halotydeus destructor]|nr:Pyridoxine/pyridoxamine 5'-phosphate oxidase 1, chloroplastic [Halotydeus destructor]